MRRLGRLASCPQLDNVFCHSLLRALRSPVCRGVLTLMYGSGLCAGPGLSDRHKRPNMCSSCQFNGGQAN